MSVWLIGKVLTFLLFVIDVSKFDEQMCLITMTLLVYISIEF